MDAKQVIESVMSVLVDSGVVSDGDIFAGRIYPQDARNNLWCVVCNGGIASGGSNAKFKSQYNIQITAYHSDAEKLYDKDKVVHQALTKLYDNPQIINLDFGPLQDMDIAGADQRQIVWNGTITTFVPGWLE